MNSDFIHTLELYYRDDFNEIKELTRNITLVNMKGKYVCTDYSSIGITIYSLPCMKEGRDGKGNYKLSLVVNPSRLIEEYTCVNRIEGYRDLEKAIDSLNCFISRLFSPLILNDFKLGRIDITRDIRKIPESVIQEYILLMRTMTLGYGYQKNKKLEENTKGFRIDDSFNGTILEPVIRREFMERTGLKVRQKHMLLQSEEYPFMLANLDGVINLDGEMCIFEAKTASAYKLDDWQSGIPPEYMLQVQHYMAVTGAVKTYIAALIGGNHFEYRLIERDDEMIAKIITMEKLFWEVNVLGGIAPEIDGTKATTEFFNSKYSFSNGQTIELPEEIVSDCEEYGRLSYEITKLTAAKDAICNRIKSLLGNNETGLAGKYKVSWKQVISSGFDKTRLKADNPELYKKYVTHSQYRRFSMS